MTRFLTGLVLICAASVAGAVELGDLRPRPLGSAVEAAEDGRWQAATRLAARDGSVALDIVEWMRLRAGVGSLAEAQAFLARRADWPGLPLLRKRSEIAAATAATAEVLAFFDESPARSGTGVLAHARALAATGRADRANTLVAEAWQALSLTEVEEAAFLERHGDVLTGLHVARLDQLLWAGRFAEARRMFPWVSADRQALAEARIALRQQDPAVDAVLAKVPAALAEDPGLFYDRFEWRARKGRWDEAKKMLLDRSASAARLGVPMRWAGRRRSLARDELREGAATRAYQMAAQHFLESGSAYADLEWLAGYIALTRLDDPALALTHFSNHEAAVRSPISMGRAGYWKGRALQAMGRAAEADMEFTRGAAYQTSFYGLLAAEAAGLPFDVGLNDVPTLDWRVSPLMQDSLFQAGVLLLASGQRDLAERFWAQLAEQLGDHDAALLGQAAIDLEEPHLAVMIGKAAARHGMIVPKPYYALHPLAQANLPMAPEMSLAIARRESEFDPAVQSGVGARGLMQLMPATARDVARGLGLAADHSTERLISDPTYNAQLGTAYLDELAAQFNGNPVMMAAAYNAGPSRPLRWIEERGDPRAQDLDPLIDWIELIPFRETRNYVMRVTESLPIYRARLGRDPLPIPFSKELMGNAFLR